MNRQELYRRTTQVFLEIVELPARDWDLALSFVCAGDPAVRKEVEALLRFHRETATDSASIDAP